MTTNDGVIDTPEDGIATHPIEAPRPSDELYQAFPNEPAVFGIDPSDGLPKPVVPHSIKSAMAPPLDPERFICMADCTRFVVRDAKWGDTVAEVPASAVERSPNGKYRVRAKDMPSGKLSMALLERLTSEWVEVEPLRPACAHYRRQFKDFTDDSEHQHVIRLCTARVTEAGQFLSLGDSEMLACELRTPAVGSNAHLIDEFDARAIEAGRRAKEREAEFDLDAELEAEQADSEYRGIFDGGPR